MKLLSSKYLITYGTIMVLWMALHVFTVGWGLPNMSSFAPDSIPANTSYTAEKALLAGGNKYAPLQYLVNSIFLKQHNERNQTVETVINLRSDRIRTMNWVTASMQLVSALILALAVALTLNSSLSSLIAASLYLLNSVSIYYSNTSNMDIPYSMWILLSLFVLALTQKYAASKAKFIMLNVIFALFMSFACLTKDQAYASYALPLIALILWQYHKYKKISLIFIECVIWIAIFILSLLAIYNAVGGIHVFWSHLNWISNDGIASYKQILPTLAGRVQLVLLSVRDICLMLDYPIIAMTFMSALFLFIYRKTIMNKAESLRYAKITALFGLATYFSILFFFVQPIQFSYTRFYLPLLPFFCCLIAWSYTQFKTNLIFRLLFLLLFVIQAVISIQFIFELKLNSRVALRNYYLGESTIKNKYIVCDGTDMGIQIVYNKSGDRQINTLRDWSQSRFGYLPVCRSIDVNPLSIAMLLPDIVISESSDDTTLLSSNYKITRTIKGYSTVFSSLYHFDTPLFYIYERNPDGKIPILMLKNFITREKFEITMLNISNLIDREILDHQVSLMAKFAPGFQTPDMSKYAIDSNAFIFLVESYKYGNRQEDLLKAYKFLMDKNMQNIFKPDADKFFRTYSSAPLRN